MNMMKIDFRLSWHIISSVDPIAVSWHCVELSCITSILKILTVSIFRVK